ncbi:hypothetical protein GQ44DRAFT_724973 [Phaeosphaeriaceae sp. PMI808]|nr:hypothetical protein GQ44DRAFT_724973 [Phaeosphaeriaceae sp. PMI808]
MASDQSAVTTQDIQSLKERRGTGLLFISLHRSIEFDPMVAQHIRNNRQGQYQHLDQSSKALQKVENDAAKSSARRPIFIRENVKDTAQLPLGYQLAVKATPLLAGSGHIPKTDSATRLWLQTRCRNALRVATTSLQKRLRAIQWGASFFVAPFPKTAACELTILRAQSFTVDMAEAGRSVNAAHGEPFPREAGSPRGLSPSSSLNLKP